MSAELLCVFFFSSRRRHTRCSRDWSSDVCSSDLSREVVFVDIALAQIAALGATAAFLAGYETDTWESYVSGLSATLLGALVLSLTRSRRRHVSQEAVRSEEHTSELQSRLHLVCR